MVANSQAVVATLWRANRAGDRHGLRRVQRGARLAAVVRASSPNGRLTTLGAYPLYRICLLDEAQEKVESTADAMREYLADGHRRHRRRPLAGAGW
jgi:hypothetical protein